MECKMSDIEQIKELTRQVYDHFMLCLATSEWVQSFNERVDIHDEYNKTHEAKGLNIVHHAALFYLIISIARICDESRRSDSQRASIPRIRAMLKNEALINILENAACGWNPDIPNIAIKNRDACRRAILSFIRTFDATWAEPSFSTRLNALRRHRDNHIAHILTKHKDDERLKFKEIFEVLDNIKPLVVDIQFAVEGMHIDVKDLQSSYRNSAESFNGLLKLGMQAVRAKRNQIGT